MTDTRTASTPEAAAAAWQSSFAAIPEARRRQNQIWFEEQSALAEEARTMTASWVKRRQDAVTAAMHTIEAATACKDMGAVATVIGDWWSGALKRVADDLNDASTEAVRLTERG